MPKTSKTKTPMDDGKPYAIKAKDDKPIPKTKRDAMTEAGKVEKTSDEAKTTLDDAKSDTPEAKFPKTSDEETAKAKTESGTDEEEKQESDTEKCPCTKAEMSQIEKKLKEMFAGEKKEAHATGGMITCPLTGNGVCFCDCGPHLTCPEHLFNCSMWWNGGYPADLDPLMIRWLQWRTGE